MTAIGSIGVSRANVSFKQNVENASKAENVSAPVQQETNDSFISSKKDVEPPKISTVRLMTGFMTDKQVEGINKAGKLPENAKFVMNGYGSYTICNNFFGMRVGTQTIPQGFEVKKNVLGQAVVLPKDSTGLMIK